jgi:RND family efflux transporter MFP subunit
MPRWKQAIWVAIIFVVAILAWLRIDPDAGTKLSAAGLSPAVVAVLTGGQSEESASMRGRPQRPGGGESLVVTANVGSALVNDRLTAIGDGEAVRSVNVVPLSTGIIADVLISSGDRVQEGEIIATLDREAEIIKRDRAKLAVEQAEQKLQRYETLVQSRAATQVQLTDARSELEDARLALRDAQLALDRRTINAPFEGIIGIVPVQTGDYVTTTTEIATIDDRSDIIVDFWVPERFAPFVKIGGDVSAMAIALPGHRYEGKVAAIGSRIEQDSRTLQIRASVNNRDDRLLPGMSFRVTMRFPGQEYTAIDPLAIQWSSSGPYVWKAVEGRAERIAVQIIQRNSDHVLVDGELTVGDQVVIEGVQGLRQGSNLRIAGNVRINTQSGT